MNDRYGHNVGDLVLVATAERLTRCIRGSDTCARLGGNESGSRVLAAIDQAFRPPFMIGETEIGPRPSVGCATAPTDGTDSATLLRVADERMYRAKSSRSTAVDG